MKVLGLYRKRSGALGPGKMRLLNAGEFSIERLEVSRFGATVLWVLNCIVGGGRGRGSRGRMDRREGKRQLENAAMLAGAIPE